MPNQRNVLIYSPTKNAMQSGKGRTKHWQLIFEKQDSRVVDPLMGWTGSNDMTQELRMEFPSLEAAVSYAEANKLTYNVVSPNKPKLDLKAYADNFTRQPK